jgi:3-phenylpropionate/trans-cinnamate dioxygenase ferredoxin subunit
MAEFVKVAQVSDVPVGEGKLVRVGDQFVALYNCDGTFYATDDNCSHAEASLSEGFLQGCEIECPLHGGRFDVRTGKATWSPAFVPVATYAVQVDGDDVLVATEPNERAK